MSRVRESVVAYLKGCAYSARPIQIADATGMNPHSVRRELQFLNIAGVVRKNALSEYRMAEPKPVVAEIMDAVVPTQEGVDVIG